MADLSRALRPLIDQPPAGPEPVKALELRVRQRRRRRRVAFAAALASAGVIVVSVGVERSGRDDPQRFEAGGSGDVSPQSVEPMAPVVVATGEIAGHPWRLQASEGESGPCVNLLEGGGACFDTSTRPAVGVAVDITVTGDATGTGRVGLDAVYGPVRRDVARISILLASGQVVDTSPVGEDAGFDVNFYVARAPTDIPAHSELSQIVAYDAAGNELARLEPDCAIPDLGGRPATLDVQIRAVDPCR
jgi:hypothetical protein